MKERVRHEYFSAPPDRDQTEEYAWFFKVREAINSAVIIQEDIRVSRATIASMLTEAWDAARFYRENAQQKPEPDESDRIQLLAHLQALASVSGLLSGEEIRLIQNAEGKIPVHDFIYEEKPLPSFEDVRRQTERWKEDGLKIYMFHGAFDPPTAIHLACATKAYVQGSFQCDGLFRLLIGFESDDSLQASKGTDRPRYTIDWRRKTFGSFWMVDSTVALRTQSYADEEQRVRDYQDLNVDYVFLAVNQEHTDKRLQQIEKAGAEPRYLPYYADSWHATDILAELKQRGW